MEIQDAYTHWKPKPHTVFKDIFLTEHLHNVGYAVKPFLSEEQISSLKKLYYEEHNLQMENGGMFYSLYSRDLEYRKRIHDQISGIVSSSFTQYFKDYKNIVNIFITKASGTKSEFYLHQDSTALNEFEHSALSVWIPLQDITESNGALTIIEKTHTFFSPYRGITIKPPFQKIQSTLKKYLKPVYLKAGEAIFFDSRLIHNSLPNYSGEDRLVVLCGIFPKDAKFITCHKDPDENSKIELIEQPDSFILENETFYHDCHSRPASGVVIARVEDNFPEMESATFIELCKKNGVKQQQLINELSTTQCHFESEPIVVKKQVTTAKNVGLFSKLKSILFTK
ncbi:MAG: phytanoyl-CoA dioxygenase family protein [Bacteroidetes bacterium]|nr:phytanoyl-CoA dioxygenase family protein [Bacteroidota bacterium]